MKPLKIKTKNVFEKQGMCYIIKENRVYISAARVIIEEEEEERKAEDKNNPLGMFSSFFTANPNANPNKIPSFGRVLDS